VTFLFCNEPINPSDARRMCAVLSRQAAAGARVEREWRSKAPASVIARSQRVRPKVAGPDDKLRDEAIRPLHTALDCLAALATMKAHSRRATTASRLIFWLR
jgi:hypothetical protein